MKDKPHGQKTPKKRPGKRDPNAAPRDETGEQIRSELQQSVAKQARLKAEFERAAADEERTRAELARAFTQRQVQPSANPPPIEYIADAHLVETPSGEQAILKTLATNLRIQRAIVGMNRTELAAEASISFKQLSLIEAGTANATMLTLQALARALGCPPFELLIPRPKRR